MTDTRVVHRKMRFVFEVEDIIQCSDIHSEKAYYKADSMPVLEGSCNKIIDFGQLTSTLVEATELAPSRPPITNTGILKMLGDLHAEGASNAWRNQKPTNLPITQANSWYRTGGQLYAGRRMDALGAEPQYVTKKDTRWRIPAWASSISQYSLLQGDDWTFIYRCIWDEGILKVAQAYGFLYTDGKWRAAKDLDAFFEEIKADLLFHSLAKQAL